MREYLGTKIGFRLSSGGQRGYIYYPRLVSTIAPSPLSTNEMPFRLVVCRGRIGVILRIKEIESCLVLESSNRQEIAGIGSLSHLELVRAECLRENRRVLHGDGVN